MMSWQPNLFNDVQPFALALCYVILHVFQELELRRAILDVEVEYHQALAQPGQLTMFPTKKNKRTIGWHDELVVFLLVIHASSGQGP
jgi:hypothetical protein